MASTDARPIPQKNVAMRVTFPILDADGDLVTGATGLDSEVSKDGGTFADCTNEATEIATNSGVYYLDLTSTEMNADTVAVIVKTTSSGAKTTVLVMYPQETGDIKVDVTSIDGQATAGNNATLNLKQLNIVNNAGDAIVASSTGSNGQGINASGNGSGDGIRATGGTTGNGVSGVGGATSGAGLKGTGSAGNSPGISGVGQGTAAGVLGTGGATGAGVEGVGGATSGSGIRGTGSNGNANGATFTGQGSAAGLQITGGTTGHGMVALGGATSGNGARFAANGSGDGASFVGTTNGDGIDASGAGTGAGVLATGGATGHGVSGVGGASSGAGIKGAGTAGNSAGIQAAGQGSAAGLAATGGATGAGIAAAGGGTSGDGISASVTGAANNGMTLAGGASGKGLSTTIPAALGNTIADHVLRRQMDNVEASTDGDALDLSSLYGAVQQSQEAAVAAGTLTVKKTDGTTTLGTKTVTTDASADLITAIS